MAEKLLLGVDLGGSSSKATLIDSQGNVLATASREYPAYSPKPGWLEQDADDLFDAVIVNIKACIEKSGIDGKAISALPLMPQRTWPCSATQTISLCADSYTGRTQEAARRQSF